METHEKPETINYALFSNVMKISRVINLTIKEVADDIMLHFFKISN